MDQEIANKTSCPPSWFFEPLGMALPHPMTHSQIKVVLPSSIPNMIDHAQQTSNDTGVSRPSARVPLSTWFPPHSPTLTKSQQMYTIDEDRVTVTLPSVTLSWSRGYMRKDNCQRILDSLEEIKKASSISSSDGSTTSPTETKNPEDRIRSGRSLSLDGYSGIIVTISPEECQLSLDSLDDISASRSSVRVIVDHDLLDSLVRDLMDRS